jgi:hypothetical protein
MCARSTTLGIFEKLENPFFSKSEREIRYYGRKDPGTMLKAALCGYHQWHNASYLINTNNMYLSVCFSTNEIHLTEP